MFLRGWGWIIKSLNRAVSNCYWDRGLFRTFFLSGFFSGLVLLHTLSLHCSSFVGLHNINLVKPNKELQWRLS